MKRQILDLYRRCVPEPVKQWIPPRVKASVLGLAYGLTGYPDLRQWQMRHLFRAGPGRWQTPRLHDPLFSCALWCPCPLPRPAPKPRLRRGGILRNSGFWW